MSKVSVTKEKLDILANAIANKSGEPLTLTLDEMVSAVDGIENNPAPTLQAKTYTVDSAGIETITADSGYDGLSKVEVSVPIADLIIDESHEFYIVNGIKKWRVRGYAEDDDGTLKGWFEGSKSGGYTSFNAVPSGTTITPSTSAQTIGGSNYMMEGAVTVNAVPLALGSSVINGSYGTSGGQRKWTAESDVYVTSEGYVTSGYISIGHGYKEYNAVPSNTTITPTESSQTIGGADTMMEGAVTVSAIPSNYVGSGITQRSSSDLTVSGATVTAPSGYYSASASKSVASGTAGTPTATKGTVSNHSVSVTPSVTNTTGYITGSTKTGTAVTVSASELVSGSETKTANGTYDVTNLASLVVDVSSAIPIPLFTLTYNSIQDKYIVSCDMTYSECASLLYVGDNIGANAHMIDVGGYESYLGGNGQYHEGQPSPVVYTFNTDSGVPWFDIVYYSDGTLEYVQPSSTLTTLNANTNGTYQPSLGKVYNEVVVNVPSSSGMKLGYSTATPDNVNKIVFTGIKGAPTSLCITSDNNISTSTPPNISTILFDGTTFEGIGIGTESNAQVSPLSSGAFIPSYDDGDQTITINTSGCQFVTANSYSLVYTYGGSSSNIDTKEVQVGSGATSITFTGLEAEPDYFSCVFESSFGTSSGYQRVITVVNDGSETYGLAMDSSAKAQTSWSYSYSNGSLTITSQGTNNGGYFHQPGYYQLTYGYGGEVSHYQSKTVTPTTSQQVVTADSGYDALSQVTVNAMPSMTLPSSTSATSSGTSKATISASSSTQYLNIPTGYNATAQYYTISASGGGGGASVTTKTVTNSSASKVSISFTGLSGAPIAFAVKCNAQLTRSSSSSYYYVTTITYDGTNHHGNYWRMSNGTYYNDTTHYSHTYSNGTLTVTSSGSRSAAGGSFYNGTYELLYIY